MTGVAVGGSTGVTCLGSIVTPGTDVYSAGLQAGAAARNTVRITGCVFNSTNAGNVTLQWAQNTSDATATVVRKGSTLLRHRIA